MNSLIPLQGEGVREPYMKMRNDRRAGVNLFVHVCVFVWSIRCDVKLKSGG